MENTWANMTAEEKIGQLFCVMGGDYSSEALREMAASGKVGGVLFRPVRSGTEIKADFQALDAVSKVPLLKAANLEEGGSGGMLDGTLFGWPMLCAASDDPDMADKFGAVCGCEGASIGVNWTFSPVCDLDMNYLNPITNVRTFGSSLNRVKEFTARYMAAVHRCGVAACAKHFPGDGVDYRDQHLHPSVNSLSTERWYETYGTVYQNLIAGGLLSVMVGHIAQPNVAGDANPALSEAERYPDIRLITLGKDEILDGSVAELAQMELYCEIGRLVSGRPEKGAAEYLSSVHPDATGFSPRNLRRMREFYRAYESDPEVLVGAMAIGWTQNMESTTQAKRSSSLPAPTTTDTTS